MQIQPIQNVNNNNHNPNFGAIKSIKYFNEFARDYTNSTKSVYQAFESSWVLNKFCKDNDVNVSFILDPMSGYHKAATLKIEKIFPQEKKGFLNKILSLFKKKDEQIIYINAIELNNNKAKEKLAKKISSIHFDFQLNKFWQHPYDEFNGYAGKKPKWTEV